MKYKTLMSSVLGCMLLVATPNLHAMHCSKGSVAGRWAFTSNGTLLLPSGPVPAAAVADFVIDAYGNIAGKQTRSLGGQVADETFAGTLSVNPDCSSEATVKVYVGGVLVRTTTLALVFDDNSRSARGIFTSLVLPDDSEVPTIFTLEARKIFVRDEN